MAVKINRGVSAYDAAGSVPPHLWDELLDARRHYCRASISGDCRLILQFVTDAEPLNWLGFGSRDVYLRDGLGVEPEVIAWAVDGLKTIGVDAPVEFAKAIEVGKLTPADRATTAQPMPAPKPPPKHSGPGRGKKVENAASDRSGVSDVIKHGENADYLTRRIARDAPAVLERMKSGEFKSVRAAAIVAGVVNPTKQLEQSAVRAVRKLSADALDRLEQAIAVRRRELGVV